MSFADPKKTDKDQDRLPSASGPVAPPTPHPGRGKSMMYYKTKPGKDQSRMPSLFNSKAKRKK